MAQPQHLSPYSMENTGESPQPRERKSSLHSPGSGITINVTASTDSGPVVPFNRSASLKINDIKEILKEPPTSTLTSSQSTDLDLAKSSPSPSPVKPPFLGGSQYNQISKSAPNLHLPNTPISEKEEKKKLKKYSKDTADEPFPSIFETDDHRTKIFENLPARKIQKAKKSPKILSCVTGPFDSQYAEEPFDRFMHGKSISTYPHLPEKPIRDGEPICDSFCIQALEDDIVVAVVADGCNWGKRPMIASNTAKSSFIEYMKSKLNEVSDMMDVGHFLVNALSYCNYKICEGKEDVWDAGTTTLLGGVLLPLKDDKGKVEKDSWVWVGVSIGDCKCLLYSNATKSIKDMSSSHRPDACDPEGRLGPYVEDGKPDLRNVSVHFAPCKEGDMIILMSDGVHDNLDPVVLGHTPASLSSQHTTEKWSDLDRKSMSDLKTSFMENFFCNQLLLGGEEDRKVRAKVFGAQEEDPLLPSAIISRVMKHCLSITSKGREWMEQNPNLKLPPHIPGKMDHCTTAIFKVTSYEALQQQSLKSSKEKQLGFGGKSV